MSLFRSLPLRNLYLPCKPVISHILRLASTSSLRMAVSKDPACIFCGICYKKDDKTELLYEDENFVAFRDIRPATVHHYLIVPKRHVETAKVLVRDDVELVERLVAVGKEVLTKVGVSGADSINQVRMGFHWPPFNGIKHLHLHVLYPASQLSFFGRIAFRPDSWWFVSPAWLVKWLERKPLQEEL